MRPNTPGRLQAPLYTARSHSLPWHRLVVPTLIAILFTAVSASGISPKKQPLPDGYRQTFSVTETAARIAANLRPDPAAKTAATLAAPSGNLSAFLDREAIETLSRAHGGAGRIAAQSSPELNALAFVGAQTGVFAITNPDAELVVESTLHTPDGRTHIVFGQCFGGLRIADSRIVFHFDADGSLIALNGRWEPTPSGFTVAEARVTPESAQKTARDAVTAKTGVTPDGFAFPFGSTDGIPAPERVIFRGSDGGLATAWRVTVAPDAGNRWSVTVDDRTGAVIEAYNTLPRATSVEGTGVDALGVTRTFLVSSENDVYSLFDTVANLATYDAHGRVIKADSDVTLVTSADNTWKDPIAVSAHANARVVYDYYLAAHNRSGVDNRRMKTPLVVHYTVDGKPYYNAFWAGQFMAFGDGLPYAAALDVVAHELTHGVVQFTAGLVYKFQSGAINEALADVMACMVDPDWTLGEDLPGGAIRDLENPGKYGLPGNMSGYKSMPLGEDNGGVHENMGIPSHAYAILATSIGREKTARIVYRLLDNLYVTPQAQFVDLRLASVQSAKDLFGTESTEASAVKVAFDAVGILDGEPSAPPVDVPTVQGGQWLAYVNGTGTIALSRKNDDDTFETFRPSSSVVYTGTARPISVSKNGDLLIFVDQINNIRTLDLKTYQERLLDNTGDWSSVALSPDGSLLAATTVYADTTIYLFDLKNTELSRKLTLYTPGTEGVKTPTALFADALDWDRTGSLILYDVCHSLPGQNGSSNIYWDINLMDVASGIITRVKTPSDNGYQVGNPSYGETNDRYMVCDFFSDELKYNAVIAYDFFTLELREIHKGRYIQNGPDVFPDVGMPRYAPDDRSVIYARTDSRGLNSAIYSFALDTDKMTPTGSATKMFSGEVPLWYVQSDATGTGDEEATSPGLFTLRGNAPNPFNASTVISYSLGITERISLAVYDVLGRKVATLFEGMQAAGDHAVRFDASGLASGVYFYRLESGGRAAAMKMTLMK